MSLGLKLQRICLSVQLSTIKKAFVLQVIRLCILKFFLPFFWPNESAYNYCIMEKNKINLRKVKKAQKNIVESGRKEDTWE